MKLIIKGLIVICIVLTLHPIGYARDMSVFKEFMKPKIRIFLVGNKDYDGTDMDLRYTVNDIIVFRQIFKTVFNVPKSRIHYYEDLTLSRFIKVGTDFANKVQKGELVVIVYTGHGNTNGMPIFVDKRTISPKKYFGIVNSFDNDTILIMDSCYSGAEGSESNILTSNDVDETTLKLRGDGDSKDRKPLKYRKNVLRIYSSLANQQSREARYKKIKGIQKHLGDTYDFLEEIGYDGDGNGIFSITFASFFAEQEFDQDNYTFNSLNSHINDKVSNLMGDSFDVQRPKITPVKSPFKNQKNFFLFSRNEDFIEKPLTVIERLYLKGFYQQMYKKNYRKAIKHYKRVLEMEGDYKSTNILLSESYYRLARKIGFNDPNTSIPLLQQSLNYNSKSILALNTLGQIYQYRENYKDALSYYKRVLKIAKENENKFWIASVSNNIGTIYARQGKDEKALKYYKQSLKMSEDLKDIAGQTTANNKIGQFYFRKNKTDKAIIYFKKSANVSRKAKEPYGHATSLNNIGQIYLHKRNNSKAIEYFTRALNILKPLPRKRERALIQLSMALAYEEQKRYSEALRYYKKSLSIYKKLKDKRGIASGNNELAMIHFKMDHSSKALSYLSKSYRLRKELKDNVGLAEIEVLRGIIYNNLKKYDKSAKHYNRAKKIYTKMDYNPGVIRVKVNLMEVYSNIAKRSIKKGKYKKTIKYSKKALVLYELAGDEISIGRTYSNIGFAYFKMKKYKKSLQNLEIGLSYSRKLEDENGARLALGYIARVSNDLGVSHAEDEEYEEAISYLQRALEVRRELKYTKSAAGTAQNIAVVYNNMEEEDKAIQYYKIAVGLYKRANAYNKLPEIYFDIASFHYESEDYKKASKNFKLSIRYYNRTNNRGKDLRETRKYLAFTSNILGDESLSEENYRKALKYYQQSIKQLGHIGLKGKVLEKAYEGVALSYWKLDKLQQAIGYQKKLLALLKKGSRKYKAHKRNLRVMEEEYKNK